MRLGKMEGGPDMAVPDEASVDSPAPLKRPQWTEEEDALLRDQVRLHGPQMWEAISAPLPGRSSHSCRLRWRRHLAPGIDAAPPFTPEEDAAVIALQQVHSNRWALIAGVLPGRNGNAIKHRWYGVLRKQQRRQQRQQQQSRTLNLFPLVPGDVRTARRVAAPVIYHAPAAESDDTEGGDSCLDLFPLAPGDIFRGDASGAAPMDANCGADDPLTQLRLFTSAPMDANCGADDLLTQLRLFTSAPTVSYPSTAEAAFRSVVHDARAP